MVMGKVKQSILFVFDIDDHLVTMWKNEVQGHTVFIASVRHRKVKDWYSLASRNNLLDSVCEAFLFVASKKDVQHHAHY